MRRGLSQRPGEWGAGARKPKQVEAKEYQGPRASTEDLVLTVSGTLHRGFMSFISHPDDFLPQTAALTTCHLGAPHPPLRSARCCSRVGSGSC